MHHESWLAALDREGRAFGAAVERVGLTAKVPSCPGWTVGDLLTHLGRVHRWVTDLVDRDSTEPFPYTDRPTEGDLLEWYRAGLSGLLDRLVRVDPQRPAWNFTPTAPKVAGFWARRQAHETAIHRWDADLAGGRDGTCDFTRELSADGVGEVLESLLPRLARREPLASARGVVRVGCTDTRDDWLVTLAPGRVDALRSTDHGHDHPDATITGPAGSVYLTVWGRRPPDTVTITGDTDLAALLRFG